VLVAAKILIMKGNTEEYAVNMDPIDTMNLMYTKNVHFEVHRSRPTVKSKQISVYHILHVSDSI
jgi:hypothetical protein